MVAEVKKVTKYDGKQKGLHFTDGIIYDEHEEEVDILAFLKAGYGDKVFDLSVTAKEEEILELEVENYIGDYDDEDFK